MEQADMPADLLFGLKAPCLANSVRFGNNPSFPG